MKPELCDDCKADLHGAYCKTFPITCRDQVEIWEDGYEVARAEMKAESRRVDETDDPRIAASLRPPKRRCLCNAAMAGERLYCSIHNRWSQP